MITNHQSNSMTNFWQNSNKFRVTITVCNAAKSNNDLEKSSSSEQNTPITEQITPISQETLNYLKTHASEIIVPRSSILRPSDVSLILNAISQKFNISIDNAKIMLAIFFQQGGTARSCDGNTTITLYDVEYKLASIRAILKECKFPRSEKKLARSLNKEIYSICKTLNLPGNLANKIRRLFPEHKFNEGDDIYLSDFQANNEDVPSELRILIQKTFDTKPKPTKKK